MFVKRFEPLKEGKIKGIKSTGKREKLLSRCEYCKCQRYTPCGCEGAVIARNKVLEGLAEAKARKFVAGPDLDADAALIEESEFIRWLVQR